MILLRFLGGASLERPDGPLGGPAAQRHRLALLALFAASHPRALSRDKLQGLLWPDRDTQHARKLLNLAVHTLRRALGDEAILSTGDELRLGSDALEAGRIGCDLIAFETALDSGDIQGAVNLYGGPFLDGFFLPGSTEFERWVDAERDRLGGRFMRALETAADGQESSGDLAAAVESWKRLAASDPFDSRIAGRLVDVLHRAGNHAGGLRHAHIHSALLREELGVEPDPRFTELLERIRRGVLPRASTPSPSPTPRLPRQEPGAPPVAPVELDRPGPQRPGFHRRRGVAVVGALSAAVLVFAALWLGGGRAPELPVGPLDRNVVAVLPFRVGGADPTLGYLEEGMVDLLAAMLTGEGGPRAMDPRSTLSAWRRAQGVGHPDLAPDASRRLAAGLGAGRVLLGEVVSAPGGLTLTARLLDVATGRRVARATATGPADSLPALAERLAVQLLAGQGGEPGDRHPALASTSLAAARPYLAGRAAFRRGEYAEAARQLERAIALDSTFALAALALHEAYVWGTTDAPVSQAFARAWSLRDRLAERDRTLLASLWPSYPATPVTGEMLRARQQAAVAVPDRAEVWLALGDALFHWGRFHGIEAAEDRAEAAFRRAVELDPGFAAPLLHLFDLAVERGDTAQIRRRRDLYLANDSTGDFAAFVRWRSALALGEEPVLTSRPEELAEVSPGSLARILYTSQTEPVALEDAPSVADALRARVSAGAEGLVVWTAIWLPLMSFALDRGRPREALPYLDRGNPRLASVTHVLNALYWDGDAAVASRAAAELAVEARDPVDAGTLPGAPLLALCVREQWRLSRGDSATVTLAKARLRATGDPADELCVFVLEALLALHRDSRAQAAVAEGLERFLRDTGVPWNSTNDHVNLVLARLHEARGDSHAALAALRRRSVGLGGRYLATYLREEGRLAERVGEHEAAIRAYRHYLTLRSDPEPSIRPQATQVAAALARLEPRSR